MELELKQRKSEFCNLKAILIFCVVFGHLLEYGIHQNLSFKIIYKCIYLFHMPLFVFLSGYFLRNFKQCIQQSKKMLELYFVLQAILLLIRFSCEKQKFYTFIQDFRLTDISWSVPYWHLWYLPALAVWSMIGAVWWLCRMHWKLLGSKWIKLLFIIITIAGTCYAGTIPVIGREWTLSRILVFLPYFLLGLFIEEEMNWKVYKRSAIVGIALAAILMSWHFGQLSYQFLWHRMPYGSLDVTKGIELRLACYAIGMSLGFAMLVFIPKHRNCISKVGNYTLEIFLFHPFILLLLQNINKQVWKEIPFVMTITCSIIIIYFIYKILQWRSLLYCIK